MIERGRRGVRGLLGQRGVLPIVNRRAELDQIEADLRELEILNGRLRRQLALAPKGRELRLIEKHVAQVGERQKALKARLSVLERSRDGG